MRTATSSQGKEWTDIVSPHDKNTSKVTFIYNIIEFADHYIAAITSHRTVYMDLNENFV